MTKMHENELEIDESFANTLIETQCPKWRRLPIVPILSSGTDNALFRLGNEYIIRLPRIEWESGSVNKSINKSILKLVILFLLCIILVLCVWYE